MERSILSIGVASNYTCLEPCLRTSVQNNCFCTCGEAKKEFILLMLLGSFFIALFFFYKKILLDSISDMLSARFVGSKQ